MALDSTPHPAAFEKILLFGVIVDGLLIGLGLIVFPRTLWQPGTWLGLTADMAILCVYGTVIWYGPGITNRSDRRILRVAVLLGGLAGGIFCLEIILEYIVLPNDNTTFGLVEFGTVFFLYFLTALLVSRRTGRICAGVMAAMWAAVIGSVLWLGGLLVVAYLFHGTPRQTQVFRAEGNYEDFLRSGGSDFDSFIMQDFMGAAFYHLLLGPAVAGSLGAVGGVTGRGIALVQRRLGLGNGNVNGSG